MNLIVPVQSCETVPVTANNPVPKKQCFKKPRKVCQTLVSTKPKVVTAKVPKEVCDHKASVHHNSRKEVKPKLTSGGIRPSQKVPSPSSQSTAGSETMVHQVQHPRLNLGLNPNNKLEDLYTTEYEIDRGYHNFRGQKQLRDKAELRNEDIEDEDEMIVDSTNTGHFL